MARSHLTLAALATAAVADLDVRSTGPHGSVGAGDFDSARLAGGAGEQWIIRVPRTQRAEAVQSADLVALRALSPGVRGRLSFQVPAYRGQAPVAQTRAILYDFVDGSPLSVSDVVVGSGLPSAVGGAVAAIHSLPTSFVTDAGLTSHTPFEAMRSSASVVDRAASTGLLPAALLERWETAIQDSQLWQFQPTVINGSLESSSVLVSGDRITGILGWQELQIADPAKDLAWVLGAPTTDAVDAVFDAYAAARGTSERQLRNRATLYHELDLAKWLLHGTHTKNADVVDDAVEMMSRLVDAVQHDEERPLVVGTTEALDVDGVADLLAATERHRP
ncbi:aminoglycoside phosphotransferase (APT) family kinase protein [Frondihabitans sp. PhB188]|uniref:phosphotransferase n=1 Tax=Frondihabitans sp. PhB188 TaxID=2485200 RepID=UPI000F4772F4|nr:phosphotransferase [Frondihabitans sp. PhB188]ROQ38428.1 aminoglycoside phosphotransferase (APT) family kinase protein [Frondihabitans sp. PhB188]